MSKEEIDALRRDTEELRDRVARLEWDKAGRVRRVPSGRITDPWQWERIPYEDRFRS